MLKLIHLDVDADGKKIPLANKKTNQIADVGKGRAIAVWGVMQYLAVGMNEGTVKIYQLDPWDHVADINKRSRWIQDLKFSPNGSMLAVGSHDNTIDVYQVPSFKRKYALKKHSSFISHIDWAEKSEYLQSNCGAYEILYWDMNTGQ